MIVRFKGVFDLDEGIRYTEDAVACSMGILDGLVLAPEDVVVVVVVVVHFL